MSLKLNYPSHYQKSLHLSYWVARQEVLQKYNLNDEFDGTPAYELLYTELTDTIALLIEENKLPTVDAYRA